MSSSPLDPKKIAEANDPQGPYRRSILRVDDLIERGFSLSGHERNVCFLNLAAGDARFATISAVSGFDFDDDARAVAPVDWDGDGDLDVWTSNRTAPMLRFLRNDHRPRGAAPDWVQIKLEATKGARDAIGARVTVRLKDGTVLTRVLKAGEGFLTQTTKWLHFGLGPDAAIDRVVVRWPGRAEETITGIKPGRHFLVREGEKSATALSPRPPVTLAAGEARPLREESIRAHAGSRMPAPRLPYATFAGERRLAGGNSGRSMSDKSLGHVVCTLRGGTEGIRSSSCGASKESGRIARALGRRHRRRHYSR